MRCLAAYSHQHSARAAAGRRTRFAEADEGGVSFWIPGFFGSLAAAPLQPGMSVFGALMPTTIAPTASNRRAHMPLTNGWTTELYESPSLPHNRQLPRGKAGLRKRCRHHCTVEAILVFRDNLAVPPDLSGSLAARRPFKSRIWFQHQRLESEIHVTLAGDVGIAGLRARPSVHSKPSAMGST
jgi:hypothetical protein